MMKRSIVSLFFLILCSFPTFTSAILMTEFYWGYAELNFEPAPAGTQIVIVVGDMADNNSEIVGSTRVMENGAFTVDIYFDDPDTIDDEGAVEGDTLTWYMGDAVCEIPTGYDTASAWKINNQYVDRYDGSPFNISAIVGTGVRPGVKGDATGDGRVDYDDLLVLAASYGSVEGDENYVAMADFNNDGSIGYDDILILAMNYGKEI